MHTPIPLSRTAPIGSRFSRRNPSILLVGNHQPTLLRLLDGWPRRGAASPAMLIRFVDAQASLAGFADDQFDRAVVQAPSIERCDEVIRHLVRIARQGLITLR